MSQIFALNYCSDLIDSITESEGRKKPKGSDVIESYVNELVSSAVRSVVVSVTCDVFPAFSDEYYADMIRFALEKRRCSLFSDLYYDELKRYGIHGNGQRIATQDQAEVVKSVIGDSIAERMQKAHKDQKTDSEHKPPKSFSSSSWMMFGLAVLGAGAAVLAAVNLKQRTH
jgi:hypothetical protein